MNLSQELVPAARARLARFPQIAPTSRGTRSKARHVRRAMADRLVEEGRACDLAEPADELLLESLRLDPGWVNAYFVLARRWAQRDGLRGPQLGARLRDVFLRVGQSNPAGRRFVEQYSDGDPYIMPPSLMAALPKTALVLRMTDDLQALDLLEYERARGGEDLAFLGRVDSPRLMCSSRDFDAFPAAKKTIVEDLMKGGKDKRVVIHGRTLVVTDPRVFGPAIDTLHFHHVLRTEVYRNRALLDGIRTVCEIGSGSGFLLCSLIAQLFDRNATFFASDISEDAVRITRKNIHRTIDELSGPAGRQRPEAQVIHTSDLLRDLPPASIDLLLTNPPYIPEYRPGPPNPYGGTDVLADMLLDNGPRVLSPHGIMIVLFSSLSETAVNRFLAASPLVALPLGSPRRVPLDLREVLGHPRWMQQLRSEGLEEDCTSRDFAFWHTLHMRCLVHPSHPIARGKATSRLRGE